MIRFAKVAYNFKLGHGPYAVVLVDFDRLGDEIIDYAVVLTVATNAEAHGQTVRVYDGAHGVNELHIYTRDGIKQPGRIFHRGNLGEGMRWAIRHTQSDYRRMIETWERR